MTEKSELAAAVKAWRGSFTAAQAAAHLDMSVRTLNGIEQGRPFAFEHLLRIAMETTKIEGGKHGTAK